MARKQKVKAEPVETYITYADEPVFCTKCGCKGREHNFTHGTCPATYSWGRSKPFPSFLHAGESEEADRKLDAALEKYWASTDTFVPRR